MERDRRYPFESMTQPPNESATLAVGLALALPDPRGEQFGDYCRDDLTFHLVNMVADTLFLDDYELREVLSASLPFSYPLEQEQGEVVMMSRSDNVGGPLADATAKEIIAQLDELGREHTLIGPLSLLVPAERAVLLPPPSLAGTIAFKDGHPLNGALYLSILDVLKILDPLEPVAGEQGPRVRKLLEYCKTARLPLSFRRG
jgi:hypothetical protein